MSPSADRLAAVLAQLARIVVGKENRCAWRWVPARPRPPADRGHPGSGQIDAGAGAGGNARAQVRARPVHERPPARRRAGRFDLRSNARRPSASTPVRSSIRSCWPTRSTARRPRRKARCSRRWRSVRSRRMARRATARSVLRHRHPESRRADRRLSAAGIATRPVPDGDRVRLSRIRAAERDLLSGGDRRAQIAELSPLADPPTLLEWQREASRHPCRAGAARLRAGPARRVPRHDRGPRTDAMTPACGGACRRAPGSCCSRPPALGR